MMVLPRNDAGAAAADYNAIAGPDFTTIRGASSSWMNAVDFCLKRNYNIYFSKMKGDLIDAEPTSKDLSK